MKCPVCGVPGFVVEYQGVELDLCPDCGGTWFDRGELDLILNQGRSLPQAPAVTDEASRRCPICRKNMDKVNIGPERRVLIDSCPDGCGLWFDRGELADLTSGLQEEGWRVAPEIREFLGGIFADRTDAEKNDPAGE